MPSSYSPNLKIELIAVGEQTDAWGGTTNDNFENVFEEAITGMATAIFPADADYDWATGYVNSVGSQAQRNLVIEVQGTLSATRSLIVPTIEKQYLIHNNTLGGQAILVKTVAGTGIIVPNGQRAHLFVNGTNVIAVVDYFPTIRAGSATLDTALPVTSGGTGSTSLATITVGTATNIAGGAANRIPYNTGAGVTSFVVAPTSPNTLLEWDGSAFVWSALPSTVGSFSAGTTGLTPNTPTTGAVVLGGTLAIANGGTGQATANAALNALLPTQTGNAGEYLTTDGSNTSWAAIPAGTTFSAGTTGFTPNSATSGAVTLAGTLNIANGGSGQTTAQAAMNAFAGAVTSGSYLRGNGTNVVMSAIQAADVPVLNQNTTGSAAALSGGAANRIPYNTAAAATSFIAAPTSSGTFLQWGGTIFSWTTPVTSLNTGTTGLIASPFAAGQAATGALTLTGTLNIANGGTGQTTANAALNALLPSQTSQNGKYLTTDGTNTSWATVSSGVTSFSTGSTGLTPATATTGAVTLGGILSASNGGTGANNLSFPSGPTTLVGTTSGQTLTNKRITKRVSSSTTVTSPLAWDSDSYDQFVITAQATNLTINADSGSPTDGQTIVFRIKDNGVARTLTWTTGTNRSFRAIGLALPSTTVANKILYVGAIFNAADLRWDVVSTAQEI